MLAVTAIVDYKVLGDRAEARKPHSELFLLHRQKGYKGFDKEEQSKAFARGKKAGNLKKLREGDDKWSWRKK